MKFVILNFFLIFFFASSEENFCTKDGQGKDCAGAIPIEELTAKDYYFDSYGHYYIHEQMLKDSSRTEAYRDSIIENKHLFMGKIVMDIGSGTGILSMFAAKAGAKHVIAIERSAIAQRSQQIIKDNHYENVITIVNSKVEDIKELPNGIEKVDIIVSEWMGYCLQYESMLNSVLYARDKWLKPDGILMPDIARLFVGAFEDSTYYPEKIDWWSSVYGFNMSSMAPMVISEPLVDKINAKNVVTQPILVKEFDLYKTKIEDLAWKSDFELKAGRTDYLHGIMTYFDVEFSKTHLKIQLSTGPLDEKTHWKQTLFYFNQSIAIVKGETLAGSFQLTPNKRNPRDIDIEISIKFNGAAEKVDGTYRYRMR